MVLPQKAVVQKQSVPGAARLELVPGRGSHPRPQTLLSWWHLLSLDAPTVAAVWVVFVGWSAGVRLSVFDPLAMFVTVWMLYAMDRLLDARPLAAEPPSNGGRRTGAALTVRRAELEDRHRFHHAHRRRFVPCLALAAIPLAYLLHRLAAPVLELYVVLAGLLAGWLVLVHAQAPASVGTRRLPKELAVGLFFPAAIFIPTVARAPELRLLLAPAAMLFAGVCTLNCLFLYAWEHPFDDSQAHATTRWALRRLVTLDLALVVLSVLLALVAQAPRGLRTLHSITRFAPSLAHAAALPAACLLSSVLLLLLHLHRDRWSALRVRALADVALLTPLLFFLYAGVKAFR